jgi:hypothetical protein
MSNAMFGNFSNYGFVKADVPQEVLDSITTETNKPLDVSMASGLAGNIEHEYQLTECMPIVDKYVSGLCNEYQNHWDPQFTNHNLDKRNWKLQKLWANFQTKGEFNPPHTHNGHFSFVIFLKIPYLMQDECSTVNVRNSNMPRAGMFSFQYINVFGELREAPQPVDKTFEGTIFLFPSVLTHQVYPFYTSDEKRITISGNVFGELDEV